MLTATGAGTSSSAFGFIICEPSFPLLYRQTLRFGEVLLGRGMLVQLALQKEWQSGDNCYRSGLWPLKASTVLRKKTLAVWVPSSGWGDGGLW